MPQDRRRASDRPSTPRRRHADEDTLFWPRLRCPRCALPHLRSYRSADNGDGSVTRYVRCQNPACGHRFKVCLE